MANVVSLLRRAINEKLAAIEKDVVRSAYPHEEYVKQCGIWQGVEWTLIELDQLTRNLPKGVSDLEELDDMDDDLTQHHN